MLPLQRIWFAVWLFIALAGLPAPARGDGKFFPPRGIKATPSIPHQRALITFRGGIETLTIETGVDSEAQALGWIIPLPAPPTAMAKVSPGALETLDLCFHPDIEVDEWTDDVVVLAFHGALYLIWALWVFQGIARKRPTFLDLLLKVFCLFILVILLDSLFLFRHFGTALHMGLPAGAEATVLQSIPVGSYDVDVLRASTPSQLDRWLEDRGYRALGPMDRTVVDGYIREGWVFPAIRLRRREKGLSRPHPVRFTFPSPRAVYPLKLTGSEAEGPLALELFVFGEKRAAAPGLEVEVAGTIEMQDGIEPIYGLGSGSSPGLLASLQEHDLHTGHAQVVEEIWDGCFFTRLSGTLTPGQMAEDIRLRWQDPEPVRKRYFTPAAAAGTTGVHALSLFCVLLLLDTVVFYYLAQFPRFNRRWTFLRYGLIPLLVLTASLWLAGYLVEPKTAVDMAVAGSTYHRFPLSIKWEWGGRLQDRLPGWEKLGPEKLKASLNALIETEEWKNEITGGSLRHRDSPGNYRIEAAGEGCRLYLYDRHGRAVPIEPLPGGVGPR